MTIYGFTPAGDETETVLGALDRNRRTFAWKCSGLDAAGARATLAPSTLTLGGLLKHLALCEDYYFAHQLLEQPMPEPWTSAPGGAADAEELWDWAWSSAADESPEELLALWRAAVDRSRAAVDTALARGDLGQPVPGSPWSTTPNLRRVVVDLVEEYARHTGHADLIRESVDGLVGEDAPTT